MSKEKWGEVFKTVDPKKRTGSIRKHYNEYGADTKWMFCKRCERSSSQRIMTVNRCPYCGNDITQI